MAEREAGEPGNPVELLQSLSDEARASILGEIARDPKTKDTLPEGAADEAIEPLSLSVATTVPGDELDAEIDRQERGDILRMRKPYALSLLVFLAAQLLFMNVVLILDGNHTLDIPASTMQVYVTATLGEIFGLVTVATRFLFSDKPFLGKH
jgi:hypothetical protein